MAKQMATTAHSVRVNQVKGGEKNIIQAIATSYSVVDKVVVLDVDVLITMQYRNTVQTGCRPLWFGSW